VLEGIVTWAEIDLDAIASNLRAFQRQVGEKVQIIAVVKANAYGHGAVAVARQALQAGASMLAVHRVTEGVELRQAGIASPVLVMGPTPPDGAGLAARWRLTPCLIDLEFAHALSSQAETLGAPIPVHVKIDTGMSRYGLMPEETLDFLHAIRELPGLILEGLFTHFATANWADQSQVRRQLAVFDEVLASTRQAGYHPPMVHAANSAAAMRLPEAHYDAIRLGVALYGMHPSSQWPPVFEIRPALTLKSRVCRLRWLPVGAGVGYGRTFITERPTLAALVPVGYGDGYHRSLSNRGYVLIRGQRASLIGRVSMDQIMVDATHISGVRQDDEVVLLGRQGEQCITAEQVADLAGTINYEVTTSLLPRVVRVYLNEGQPG
jgi:alanine racemase